MKTWNEVQVEKLQLERDQEGLENTQRSVRQTEESYEEYFFHQSTLFEELQEEFAQSETDLLYQEMAEQIHWQKRALQEVLEEQEHEVKKELQGIEDKKEALAWAERAIAKAEKEEQNEY